MCTCGAYSGFLCQPCGGRLEQTWLKEQRTEIVWPCLEHRSGLCSFLHDSLACLLEPQFFLLFLVRRDITNRIFNRAVDRSVTLSLGDRYSQELLFRLRVCRFYVHGFVHRKSILINIQRYATICSLYFILLHYHSACFGCRPHPSSGLHKTVVTATGTSSCSYLTPTLPDLATSEIRLVPVAVTTVLCTRVDGCGRLPKHVE